MITGKRFAVTLLLLAMLGGHASAQEAVPAEIAAAEQLQINLNTVWTCIAAFLVFSCKQDSPWWRPGSRVPRTPSTSL